MNRTKPFKPTATELTFGCFLAAAAMMNGRLDAQTNPVATADAGRPVETAPETIIAARGGAVVTTDIEYGRTGDESLHLDASVPEGAGPFPVAILVHGGGWSGGDKQKDITPLFEPLTKAKFTWFSINYRLAPKHRWPAGFDDVQTAIRWVKAHAAEYKGDPRRIALLGHSAGGQLICQAAALAGHDTRVQAVVGFAPPTDLVADCERRGGVSPALRDLLARPEALDDEVRATLRDVSPINHIKPGLPPFLLIHGAEDKSVLHAQSVNFQARLKQAGVSCDLITIEKAPHAIIAWEKIDTSYKNRMVVWLARTLNAPDRP